VGTPGAINRALAQAYDLLLGSDEARERLWGGPQPPHRGRPEGPHGRAHLRKVPRS